MINDNFPALKDIVAHEKGLVSTEKENYKLMLDETKIESCHIYNPVKVLQTCDCIFPKSFDFSLGYGNLEDLTITHCSLFEFPTIITKLFLLRSLDISYNNLLELPFEIGHLINLEYLKCDFNQITKIPPSLGRLINLKVINLSRNSISQLPSNLGFLKKLQVLDVSYNLLTHFPDRIPLSGNLKILNVKHNMLHEVPKALSDCSNLVECDFSNNYLNDLPQWLTSLNNLKILNVNENMLCNLEVNNSCRLEVLGMMKNMLVVNESFSFNCFPMLRILKIGNFERSHLTFNSMKKWSKPLQELIFLEHLDCCGVGLEELPETFGRLVCLRWLDLSFNDLFNLPTSICNLKDLRFLNLSHNIINCLPDCIGSLSWLQHLVLHHNHLMKLPSSFESLNQLTFCDLSFNEFLEFPDVLRSLKNIQCLDLYKNNFEMDTRIQPDHMTSAIRRSNGWKYLIEDTMDKSKSERFMENENKEINEETSHHSKYMDDEEIQQEICSDDGGLKDRVFEELQDEWDSEDSSNIVPTAYLLQTELTLSSESKDKLMG